MSINQRLKEARKYAKLSQEELALAVGCTQGLISKIERGDQDGTGLIVQIAQICKVSPNWLALGTGSMFDLHSRWEINYQDSVELSHQLKLEQQAGSYEKLMVAGKEMLPNEISLINMYKKLSIDSKAMIDALCNKLYTLEHPEDKIAAPFKNKPDKQRNGN